MITVPNQKIVRIEKEPCGKGNLYAAINLKALEAAAQNLDAGAFKLWIYFAKNQNGYEFALSSKDANTTFGLGKSQYDTAVKKLIASGYLINTQGNQYTFSETPASEAPLYQNNTTSLFENNTRNNTYNTEATAGDNGAVKEPNVHSRPHYNFISSKPMKEKMHNTPLPPEKASKGHSGSVLFFHGFVAELVEVVTDRNEKNLKSDG
ncbi:MAG: hypothetical protein SOR74_08670, partial [Candidatus Faecivicinus sp.]|nr:hypothetical protein [Candidatus Faecivicinus sp.]